MKRELQILILEDNATVADLVNQVLRNAGLIFSSLLIERPADLTAALDRQSWDIVISDYSMPAFTGIDALRMFRERDQETPFILMTANPSDCLAKAVKEGGGQGFFDKSDLFELPESVMQLIG